MNDLADDTALCACGHERHRHWLGSDYCGDCVKDFQFGCGSFREQGLPPAATCTCGHGWRKHDEEGCMACGCASTRHRGADATGPAALPE